MDISDRLKQFHTSKTGAVKFKTLPEEYHADIIAATSEYKSYHDGHIKIRAWILVNDKDIPKCEKCNKTFYPKSQWEWKREVRFCSKKCANSSDATRTKFKQTMLERYGVDNPRKSPEIIKTARKRNLCEYGVMNTRLPNEVTKILESKDLLDEQLGIYSVPQLAEKLNVDMTTIYKYANQYDIVPYRFDGFEQNVINILKDMNVSYTRNSRKIIKPLEIDIFLPEHNIAIECNGDYWHSHEKLQDKLYHYTKWKMCNDRGIHLIQIFESDWNKHQDKFEAMILSLIGLKDDGTPARKCLITRIDAKIARPFVDEYHLQNFVGGTHFGAFDNENKLVGVMTFGYTRGSKESRRFELKRWVTDNKTHPGLFSKTFKFAQQEMNFHEVVSFSMNDWFTGDVYEKCGFSKGRVLMPGYSYLFKNQRTHLSNFTKANIKKKFPDIFNESLTEREMMEKLGIPKIYDSGKIEWIWSIHK